MISAEGELLSSPSHALCRAENRGLLLVSVRLSAVEIRLYFDDVLNQLTENQSIARAGGHSNTGDQEGHVSWFGVEQGRRDRTKLITTACGLMETAIGAFTEEADSMETELGSDAVGSHRVQRLPGKVLVAPARHR